MSLPSPASPGTLVLPRPLLPCVLPMWLARRGQWAGLCPASLHLRMGEDRPVAQPGRNTPGVLNPGPEWLLWEQSWTVNRKCGQKTAQPGEVQGGLGGWWPFQSRLWDETLWPPLAPSTTLISAWLAGEVTRAPPQASQLVARFIRRCFSSAPGDGTREQRKRQLLLHHGRNPLWVWNFLERNAAQVVHGGRE